MEAATRNYQKRMEELQQKWLRKPVHLPAQFAQHRKGISLFREGGQTEEVKEEEAEHVLQDVRRGEAASDGSEEEPLDQSQVQRLEAFLPPSREASRSSQLLARGLTVVREQKKKATVRQGDAETLAAGGDNTEALDHPEMQPLAVFLAS